MKEKLLKHILTGWENIVDDAVNEIHQQLPADKIRKEESMTGGYKTSDCTGPLQDLSVAIRNLSDSLTEQ